MNVKEYKDYKYVMGDTSSIYLGGKYTYREMLDSDEVPFKFQSIIEHYLLKDTNPETSLESQFYYMTPDSFSYRTYLQLKTRVKVCELVEKKSLFGKVTRNYQQKIYTLKDFAAINLAQKKMRGFVVQEIILSKLAVAFFNV